MIPMFRIFERSASSPEGEGDKPYRRADVDIGLRKKQFGPLAALCTRKSHEIRIESRKKG